MFARFNLHTHTFIQNYAQSAHTRNLLSKVNSHKHTSGVCHAHLLSCFCVKRSHFVFATAKNYLVRGASIFLSNREFSVHF